MAKNPAYTPEQIEWLKENIKGKMYRDIVPEFNKRFNENRTTAGLRNFCKQVLHINTGLNSCYKHPIGTILETKEGSLQIKIGKNKWQSYARYIWEQQYNEKLKPEETIIHLDGNKLNNNINNLYKTKTIVHLGVIRAYHIESNNPEIMKTAIMTQELKQLIKEK